MDSSSVCLFSVGQDSHHIIPIYLCRLCGKKLVCWRCILTAKLTGHTNNVLLVCMNVNRLWWIFCLFTRNISLTSPLSSAFCRLQSPSSSSYSVVNKDDDAVKTRLSCPSSVQHLLPLLSSHQLYQPHSHGQLRSGSESKEWTWTL